MTNGICPFATFVPGLIEGKSYSHGGAVARVGFCDHTAGGYMGTMKNPGFWNGQGVSAHFAISLTGEIIQLVNIFDTAWCQGRLGPTQSWAPYAQMRKETGTGNPNAWLISTEHEDQTVTNLVWPEAMYQADLRVKRWCVEEVRRVMDVDLLRFGLDSLTGHFMFDSVDRAYCPGKNWPRERLFADLTGGGDELSEAEKRELEARRAFDDINRTFLADYRHVKRTRDPRGYDVIEVLNPDDTPVDPPIIIAIRS